jgi:hypothetical protein
MKRMLFLCIFTVFLVFFISCTARISGTLYGDGQAELHIYAALEPRITALIGGFALISGSVQPGAPILSGPAISASMSSAPGIDSVSFLNVSPAAIEGPVKISHIGDFLKGNKTSGFINFEQSSAGGRCTISLDLESGHEILGLISSEISDYLNALMAPLATGEILKKAEYLTLVGNVYGRGIADEIARASVSVSINFPGQVQSVKGGTFSGRRAEFNIPLLDILVLETPLFYEVTWR